MENRRRIKRRPNGQMATIGFHRRLLPLVLYHRAEHCRLLPSSTCPPRNFRNATFATQEPEDQSHILLLYHICTWGHQFHSAHFHSAYFHSVHFHSAYFHSAYFHSAHFHSAHFHSVQFSLSPFSLSSLSLSPFSLSYFTKGYFHSVHLNFLPKVISNLYIT